MRLVEAVYSEFSDDPYQPFCGETGRHAVSYAHESILSREQFEGLFEIDRIPEIAVVPMPYVEEFKDERFQGVQFYERGEYDEYEEASRRWPGHVALPADARWMVYDTFEDVLAVVAETHAAARAICDRLGPPDAIERMIESLEEGAAYGDDASYAVDLLRQTYGDEFTDQVLRGRLSG